LSDTTFENETPSDIIDATQNAVIEAVSNVSEMIEKTSDESTFSTHHSSEIFYLSAEFWVGMAFVLVVAALIKPVSKALKALLIKRRDRIIAELDEAAALKSEAQMLLAKYERLFLNAKKEVDAIVSETSNNMIAFEKEQKQSLETELEQKKKQAQKQIDGEIEKTRSALNAQITNKTIAIVTQKLNENLTQKQKSKLIDASIQNILQKL